MRSHLLEPRFWGAPELTIRELIGSINTSAFVGTNLLNPEPLLPSSLANARPSQNWVVDHLGALELHLEVGGDEPGRDRHTC